MQAGHCWLDMQLLCRSDAATAALADSAVIRYSFPGRIIEYETPQRPDRAKSSKRSIKPPGYREHDLKRSHSGTQIAHSTSSACFLLDMRLRYKSHSDFIVADSSKWHRWSKAPTFVKIPRQPLLDWCFTYLLLPHSAGFSMNTKLGREALLSIRRYAT